MAELTEQKIIEIMQQEWSSHLQEVEKSLQTLLGKDAESALSPETKVTHLGSGLLYTVAEIQPNCIVLRTPEGKLFPVDEDEFKEQYGLS